MTDNTNTAATSGDAPARTSIVQDVRDLFSACGFEVREGAGFCELVGSIDAGGVLVEAVLTDFGAGRIENVTEAVSTDLQQLKALALAFQNENGEHWYNYLQLADGISYESAADFMVKVSPAVVLGLIARIERNEVESYRRGYVEGMEEGARLAVEPATASGDELPPLPEPVRFAQWTGGVELAYTEDQMRAYARAAVSAATKPTADAEDLAFNATRLRNVARLVGLEKSIPEDDATLDGARGSVLGLIAGTLRNAATKQPSERDMAIAQAVRQACCNCYSLDDSADDWSDKMGDIDLSSIIARFPHAATKPTADLSSFDADHFKQLLRDVSNESYFCGINLDNDEAYAGHLALAEAADKAIIDYVQSLLATKPAADTLNR